MDGIFGMHSIRPLGPTPPPSRYITTPSLAFNSDLDPGNGMRPHPGLPLIALYVACVAAPAAVIILLIR